MKRRDLTTEELALWRQAMRNTTPLPGREQDTGLEATAEPEPAGGALPIPGPARPVPVPRPSAVGAAKPPEPAAVQPASPPAGVDAATRRRLRRGRIEIEARCDLHGMRQWQAHGVLSRFIAESQSAGRRCVLVITGKGGRAPDTGDADFMQHHEDGVLRRRVPLWLRQEPNASRVFAIESAHARHGGSGAFYVFLRKAQKSRP